MTARPRLIGLTGTNGSGKGEAALFLASLGYACYSLSDVLREELRARGLEASRDNLIRIGNELRRLYGSDVLALRVMDKVGAGPAVIDSIRNLSEVGFLRKQEGFILIAIDAPLELRFSRVAARGRDESAVTLEEFRRKEAEERAGDASRQQLDACIAAADYVIVNDGTIEELHRKLEKCL